MDSSDLTELIKVGKSKWVGLSLQTQITWQLTKLTSNVMPFSFYRCEMSGFDVRSFGNGVSFNAINAIQKAFCEAWERICLFHFCPGESSDGAAAGLTREDAARRSNEEKIERAVMLECWRRQEGWIPYQPSSMRVTLFSHIFALQGWRINFFNLFSNAGLVRACLFRHPQFGAAFDCAYVSTLTTDKDVDLKLVLSNLRVVYLPKSEALKTLPNCAGPDEHRRYYQDPSHLSAFDFLEARSENASLILENLREVKTDVLVDESNFPAVCRTTHPTWPKLTWGTQSIQGKNPWPHPLA
jgi:hypothetical protein